MMMEFEKDPFIEILKKEPPKELLDELKKLSTDSHLVKALKFSYSFLCEDVEKCEKRDKAIEMLCDAICNEIGDESFYEFITDKVNDYE